MLQPGREALDHQQLGVVWSLLLKADSEGATFISHAACAQSVRSSSAPSFLCACGELPMSQRFFKLADDVHVPLSWHLATRGTHVIWGATARIFRDFLQHVTQVPGMAATLGL